MVNPDAAGRQAGRPALRKGFGVQVRGHVKGEKDYMELSVSGRQRRTAQVMGTAPQTEKKTSGGKTSPLRAKSDRTAWSQAALSFLREVNRQDMEKQRKLLEQKQKGKDELDCLTKSLKTMEKCRKIASRIMKGDKVPPQDEQYLMEADPEGYKLAIACRAPKEKPREWDSVLEDGEDGGEPAETAASAGEAPEA